MERGALQVHNNELVSCIEELREKREAVERQLRAEEAQRERVQQELQALTVELSHINNSISKKIAAKGEYDRVIEETEAAYVKILNSSQALLEVLKRHTLGPDEADGGAELSLSSRRPHRPGGGVEAGCDSPRGHKGKEAFQIRSF